MCNPRFQNFLPIVAIILAETVFSQCPPMALVPETPHVVTCSNTSCSVSPVAGRWNVVGATSAGNWDLIIPASSTGLELAISNLPLGSADYVVANGFLGAISTGPAGVFGFNQPPSCTIHHASLTSLTINAPLSTSFAAAQAVQVFDFTVLTPGPDAVTVGGNASPLLHWDLHGPGTNSFWRARAGRIAGGAMNSVQWLNLDAGTHALVVVRESTTLPGSVPLTATVTCGTSQSQLAPEVPVQAVAPCQAFDATPAQGRFNVIGVDSSSNWNVAAARPDSG